MSIGEQETPMIDHRTISSREAVDRIEIRELIDTYATYADQRRRHDQAALYDEYGRTEVYTADPATSAPAQVLVGHEEHAEGFRTLEQYQRTMHFNGQSILQLDGDRATGQTYCLAHHLSDNGAGRSLLVMGIRYDDTFVRHDGAWRFAERKLVIDWTDRRPSMP